MRKVCTHTRSEANRTGRGAWENAGNVVWSRPQTPAICMAYSPYGGVSLLLNM
nr:MAG TPA: hypothetical protein [Caudoviricetes sp.]